MKMKENSMKYSLIIISILIFSNIVFSQSDTTVSKHNSNFTVGFEIDALPYLTGGYYGSVWLGLKKQKLRLRPIIAKANLPSFLLQENFNRNTLRVYAFVADYFFRPDFKGFWIAPGIEYWDGEIENKLSEAATCIEWIFTFGGGYVWKFWDNLYVNPWIAGHLRIGGDREVQVGTDTFKTAVFTPEISLKIGWHF